MKEITPLLPTSAFVGLEGIAHLCTGGEAPWLREQDEQYRTFAAWKSDGKAGRDRVYASGEGCRTRMGRLWGVAPERIGFMPSAAEGMAWLARGLNWREGDNVVSTNLEFPSVAYSWRNLREAGVETRLVAHENWEVSEYDLLQAVDERTRVLAVSHVSFFTGQCLDITRLSNELAQRFPDTLLAVDATHASGVVRVPADVTDLCVSSSYKWMLGTHGIAPCYLSERAENRIVESSFGWHNLQVWPPQGAERDDEVEVKPMPDKLEPGNPAMVVVMFLERALGVLLDLGIDEIENHARDLSEVIGDGLGCAGHTVISPHRRSARSGNTCFLADDAAGVQAELAQRGVLVWGEYGRVRVSGHIYNGSADVERFLDTLTEVVRGQ